MGYPAVQFSRVVKAYGAAGDTAHLYGPGTFKPGTNPSMYVGDYTVWANGFAPLNWYPSGRPAPSSPASVDAALPLMFGDDAPSAAVPKKKSLSAVDMAILGFDDL